MSFFGKNIKYLRSQKQLSQTAFADLLGLKRAVIGAYEEERAEPRVEVFVKVSKLFSVDLESLIMRDLSKDGFRPVSGSKDSSMIPVVTDTNINRYVLSLKDGSVFTSEKNISLTDQNVENYLAVELHGSLLVVRPQGSGVLSPKNILVLSGNRFMLPVEVPAGGVVQKVFEIVYILKKYDSADTTELALRAIFEKLG